MTLTVFAHSAISGHVGVDSNAALQAYADTGGVVTYADTEEQLNATVAVTGGFITQIG